MYLTQTYISPPKVVTELPKPNKDLLNVLHGGVVGRQFILPGRRAAWKLDGAVRHFLFRLKEKGMMDKEEGSFQRALGLKYM